MQFGEAIVVCLQKYATFSGRASRAEFWYFALFQVLVGIVSGIIDSTFFPTTDGPLNWIGTVLLFLPGVAVACRRLHDCDKSGWLQLLMLTIVGLIPLVVWWATRGTSGDNRYGPDPLRSAVASS